MLSSEEQSAILEFQTLCEMIDKDLILLEKESCQYFDSCFKVTWGSQSVWVYYRIAVTV